ncbi:unnamed protein product [Larinioides sclopetarius]|uniref:Uncharacterized protein n=1 Tax=Larinioides sclopetarius TaxID=280406 RepID=A0AAV2B9E8_9ARAC
MRVDACWNGRKCRLIGNDPLACGPGKLPSALGFNRKFIESSKFSHNSYVQRGHATIVNDIYVANFTLPRPSISCQWHQHF